MAQSELRDKVRGQRMLLTKWIKVYNSTYNEEEQEGAARELANVLDWAKSVGMSTAEVVKYRNLPHHALELLEAGEGLGFSFEESEAREAEKEVASSVNTTSVTRLGEGTGSVYAYGYGCLPDRLKIGRADGDVVSRIVRQINALTPDRPKLYLVLATKNPGALERALHGALVLRNRRVEGGGDEWFRTTVDEVLTLYRALFDGQ